MPNSKYELKKGSLTIEYEFQANDPNDPPCGDYFGIISVTTGSGHTLNLRHVDKRMLEEVLLKVYHNSTT